MLFVVCSLHVCFSLFALFSSRVIIFCNANYIFTVVFFMFCLSSFFCSILLFVMKFEDCMNEAALLRTLCSACLMVCVLTFLFFLDFLHCLRHLFVVICFVLFVLSKGTSVSEQKQKEKLSFLKKSFLTYTLSLSLSHTTHTRFLRFLIFMSYFLLLFVKQCKCSSSGSKTKLTRRRSKTNSCCSLHVLRLLFVFYFLKSLFPSI